MSCRCSGTVQIAVVPGHFNGRLSDQAISDRRSKLGSAQKPVAWVATWLEGCIVEAGSSGEFLEFHHLWRVSESCNSSRLLSSCVIWASPPYRSRSSAPT